MSMLDSMLGVVGGGGGGSVSLVQVTDSASIEGDVSNPTTEPNITLNLTEGLFDISLGVSFIQWNYADQIVFVNPINLETGDIVNRLPLANLYGGAAGTVLAGLANGTNADYTPDPVLGGGFVEGTLGINSTHGGITTLRGSSNNNINFVYPETTDEAGKFLKCNGPAITDATSWESVVTSFNGHQGDVELTSLDVTTALGYAPGIGSVTSVGLTAPSIFSVAGSPVIDSGTLALSLASQTANRIFAGPATGAAASPTFRSLVAADLNGLVVPSVNGTASQILVNAATTPQTGEVTLTLPSAIVTPGTLSVNGALRASSSATVNATGPYGLSIRGTQSTDTEGNYPQAAILIESVFQTPNGTFSPINGITNIPRFIAASTKTHPLCAAYYSSINSSANIGTITKLASFYSDNFASVGGTVSSVYGFYGVDPNTGALAQAAYFDNLSVGYPSYDLKSTNKSIFKGDILVATTAAPTVSSAITSSVATANKAHFVLAGKGFDGSNADDGIALSIVRNASADRQFAIGDSALMASSSSSVVIRFVPGSSATIDAIATDASTLKKIIIGNTTGGVGLVGKVSAGSSNFAAINSFDVAGAAAFGDYAGVDTAPSNGIIVSGLSGFATPNPAASSLSSGLAIGAAFSIFGNAGLPVNAGAYIFAASGFSSPNSGRIYIGDGTGWSMRFAKRSASADTDIFNFQDNGNFGINGASYGSGSGVLFIANSTIPSSNPVGGGILYVDSGALKYRGSSGTITTIAAA